MSPADATLTTSVAILYLPNQQENMVRYDGFA